MTGILPGGVRAVMTFVADPAAAARWYASALGAGTAAVTVLESGFAHLTVAGVELAFHPADPERNPPGRSTVVYWSVPSVGRARDALLAHGAVPLRGPLRIAGDRSICQLVDPFGGVLGLDGPP